MNALIIGAVVPVLFTLMVNINPAKDVHLLWFILPRRDQRPDRAGVVRGHGIYLSFLLTVIGSMVARARGWVPEGAFRLGGGRGR